MAYITISNSKKIIRKLDEMQLDAIAEKLYKWDIYFFSKRESANLKGIRELLRDPINFATHYYHPIVVVDTLRYVFPESKPAYHKDSTCERLHSHFRNVEIPFEIRNIGKDECIKFRNWFNKNTFKQDDPKDYIRKLQAAFPYIGEINPRAIDYNNSGTEEKVNYSLKELEKNIDDVLRAAANFFKSNPDKQNIIRRFQKWTFLAYITGDLYNNDSGLSDQELKSFLGDYEKNFKTPVKESLIEYYRLQFNPEMTFDSNLLDKLGFRICYKCYSENEDFLPSTRYSGETNEDEDLLF